MLTVSMQTASDDICQQCGRSSPCVEILTSMLTAPVLRILAVRGPIASFHFKQRQRLQCSDTGFPFVSMRESWSC